MITTEQEYDLPYLFRRAKEIDKEKAIKIGAAYVDQDITFKEACKQFGEIIEA